MNSSHKIITKPIIAFLFALSLFIGIAGSALCEETYMFERMWPALQQPWYFNHPHDLAADDSGYIYVADTRNHCVQKFTSNGKYITKWGSKSDFEYAWSIAVDNNGTIYVATQYPRGIQVFNADGMFIKLFGEDGSGDGALSTPKGIAIDKNGFIYVADAVYDCIKKYSSDGIFISSWDGFNEPEAVTVDNLGYIFVADTYNHQIKKFSSDGDLILTLEGFEYPTGIEADEAGYIYVCDHNKVRKYNTSGDFVTDYSLEEISSSYYGLTVDRNGFVYVSDYYGGITKLASNLEFISFWGSRDSGNGYLKMPHGITIDNNDDVFVVDSQNYRIQKFTSQGQFISKWGSMGNGTGEFKVPLDIAIDNNGFVYISNVDSSAGIHQVLKFSPDGQFISTLGSMGSGDGEFNWPTGIAISNDNYLYVVDKSNHRIQKFTLDGQFVLKWGSEGYHGGDGEFYMPVDIAVDDSGYVYVLDGAQNSRVQKFSSNGQFILQFGSFGTNEGELSDAKGIEVDNNGFVYVVDFRNFRIQKFDSAGNYITSWGSEGSAPGMFSLHTGGLMGIDIDSTGRVFVSDIGNNRVQVFKKVTVDEKSKSIIVAGGGAFEGNNLWDATQLNANFAYRTLTYQGFTKETIYYLTSDTDLDLDSNGELDDVDADTTNANLQNAITAWAADADNLVLYLVDHGGNGTFRMSGTETLSVSDLDSWLDQLQNNTSCKVTVIYDACESGSFMSHLTPPADKERIILGSTSPGQSAYFVSQGSISFSNYFWTHIFNGLNIKEAFDLAAASISFTTDYQTPLIDDNGNGIGNEVGDGLLAQNTFIGNGTIIYGDAPVIGSVSPEQNITGTNSAQLFAEDVTDTDGIARIWATVRSPDYTQGSTYNPVQELPSFDLMPADNNRWEATWDGFSNSGTYYVSIYARDRIGNTSVPKITTVSVNSPLRHKAVIIASSWQSDELWPAIEKNARLAYNALKFQGYTDDDVYVMSSQTISDITVDGDATKSNLTSVLNTWASASAQDIVLYMVVNGNHKSFRINQTENISADELDALLDNLQNSISGKITVIFDACRSGSFLSLLVPPVGKERILISSTSSDQPARFLSGGDISFSRFFWSQVLNGSGIYKAFVQAKNAMWYSSNGTQVAYLDDNRNGIGNEKSDGQVARYYTLGTGIMLAGDAPLIGSILPAQDLNGEPTLTTIWAQDVTTTGSIDKVWAVITPPKSNLVSPDEPVTDLPTVDLVYNSNSNRYEGTYNNFITCGTYNIAVFAKDTSGNISAPAATTVTQTNGPDVYESDDTYDIANIIVIDNVTAQQHTFHDVDDTDWVRFYGVAGKTYEIKAENVSPSADVVVVLYDTDGQTQLTNPDNIGDNGINGEGELISWQCPSDGIYYAKVYEYYGNSGQDYSYDMRVYQPVGAGTGRLVGRISDDLNNGISGALVQSDAGMTAISLPSGYYIMFLPIGTYSVTATTAGYMANVQSSVEVANEGTTMLNFVMLDADADTDGDGIPNIEDAFPNDPIDKGDMNNDSNVDIIDAILSLQAMAGLGSASDVYKQADVNGDNKIGLEEVIYILQMVSILRQ